ncbi:MAG TPA: nucleotidyl transferase AbiEii/AbiGii toxin family protein [Chthoniobacterales bacterium]|nr:nucleotidyl transferase AbiEii/AbiGii toxin family protein [Chthoniobacterales bacterium]
MTAEEVYESVTNGGATHFKQVVEILDRYGPWCLIGGLAVNHYVEPVYTVDADVVIVAGRLAKIQEALVSAGFRVKVFPHWVNATKHNSKLALQFTIAERYQPFIEHAQAGEVLGCTVPVASLPDIVQGKVWAWSDPTRRLNKQMKDELDLVRIGEKYPEMRKLMPDPVVQRIESGRGM